MDNSIIVDFPRGTLLYQARNEIRLVGDYVVKRFAVPSWYNRIIYTYFRQPKAERAFRNAQRLIALGVPTPKPIEYILCGDKLLAESYLITDYSPLKRNFYEFREHGVDGYEAVIHAFAILTARMHSLGVLHLDYSPGNILWDYDDSGVPQFQLVDINRMRFGQEVSMRTAAKGFCRLWGDDDFFRLLAREYASARGYETARFTQLTLRYHRRFWRFRK